MGRYVCCHACEGERTFEPHTDPEKDDPQAPHKSLVVFSPTPNLLNSCMYALQVNPVNILNLLTFFTSETYCWLYTLYMYRYVHVHCLSNEYLFHIVLLLSIK